MCVVICVKCLCVSVYSMCMCVFGACINMCCPMWVSVGDLCVCVWGLCIHAKSRDKNLDVYLYHCCSIFSVAVIKTFSPKETWSQGNWGRISLAYTVRLTVHH